MNNVFMWLGRPIVRNALIFMTLFFASLIAMSWLDAVLFASIVTLALHLKKLKKSQTTD